MKFVEEWSENDKIVIFDEIGKGIYNLTWEVPIYDQYEKFSMDFWLVLQLGLEQHDFQYEG